ncbi:MAG: hypothetical protein HXS40_10635, partial [Theionarchaea archaeon]|nr:hypothetical protein [Theionarchaea archaeon]
MDLYGSHNQDEINNLSSTFELDLDMPVGQYSYGMKRKLYLLEAFVSSKKILLFDEPTLGLDSETRDQFFSLIKDRGTVIYGTNKVEEARHADRILLIQHGELQETTVTALLENLIRVDIYMEKEKITDYIG